MGPEEILILDGLRSVVHPLNPDPIFAPERLASINWSRFLSLAKHHNVLAFIAHSAQLKDSLEAFPSTIRATLLQSLQHSQFAMAKKMCEFKRIAQVFSKEQIEIIPLKGISITSSIYQKLPYRMMSDMDFLIRESDLEKTCHLLMELGFHSELGFGNLWHEEIKRNIIRQKGIQWLFYPKGRHGFRHPNGMRIDIHVRPSYWIGDTRLTFEPVFFWNCAKLKEVEETNVFFLPELQQLVFISVHAINGFSPKLHQLLDIALLMRKLSGEIKNLHDVIAAYPTSVKRIILTFLDEVDSFFKAKPTLDTNDQHSGGFVYSFLETTPKDREQSLRRLKPSPPELAASSYLITVLSLLNSPIDKAQFILGYLIPDLNLYPEASTFRVCFNHFSSLVRRAPGFFPRHFN